MSTIHLVSAATGARIQDITTPDGTNLVDWVQVADFAAEQQKREQLHAATANPALLAWQGVNINDFPSAP